MRGSTAYFLLFGTGFFWGVPNSKATGCLPRFEEFLQHVHPILVPFLGSFWDAYDNGYQLAGTQGVTCLDHGMELGEVSWTRFQPVVTGMPEIIELIPRVSLFQTCPVCL